jgi:C-terminal processing protease CtpA/Prc
VGEVRAGKAAADAGIQPDDLVLGLAGKLLTNEDPLGELDEIADEMKQKRSGRKVAILVLREGKPEKIGIVIP